MDEEMMQKEFVRESLKHMESMRDKVCFSNLMMVIQTVAFVIISIKLLVAL